jgi:4-diphosphocytidyl-2-C-methyl-D-erythritol kinase
VRQLTAVRVRCPAKVNLGLWILARRPDGYHEIDTILQAVALEDEVSIERADSGFSLEARGISIPGPGPNLIERAWESIRGRTKAKKDSGIRVRLLKRIPVGAGLGGGSSDAAGLLVGASRLLGLDLEEGELEALGSALGSDVPFFFRGGTARATGRGEQVRQLCPMRPLWVVLASPPFAVSTSWAYGKVRNRLTPGSDGATVLASVLSAGDARTIAAAMRNCFEDVVLPVHRSLEGLKQAVESDGTVRALLSGSGSTVFGLAPSRDDAEAAATRAARLGSVVRVVRTLERGVFVTPIA